MKKILFVLALGAFAACGGGSNQSTTTDSTATDTTTVAPMDTTTHVDSTKADSSKGM